MAKPIRHLHVANKIQLTPNMLRLELGGDDLQDFPQEQESGYVKLLFPQTQKASGLKALIPGNKPRSRSYTIRSFDADALTLTLDFVAHGDNGPASAWAMAAQTGDEISIQGPGPTKLVDMQADWFFLAGDMSALPAIAANLERLPAHAKGYAVIEIIHADDKQTLTAPAGIEVIWIVNPSPEHNNNAWNIAVQDLPWLDGTPSVWVAGEFEGMRKLRRYFKQQREVGRKQIYASSYWKIGASDEGNKVAKRLDLKAL